MRDELEFIGLAPLFGVFGALSTAIAWEISAITFLEAVPAQLSVLACLTAGLGGPAFLWMMVLVLTRRHQYRSGALVLRRAASVGLGLIITAELGFYIPLGFFAIAFQ